MSALNDVFDPRREPRQAMSTMARMVSADWQAHTVELTEISASGFRAMHPACVRPGETVRVAIPGLGPKDARVTWATRGVFGAEFCSPADLRLLFLGGPVAPRTTWLERAAA